MWLLKLCFPWCFCPLCAYVWALIVETSEQNDGCSNPHNWIENEAVYMWWWKTQSSQSLVGYWGLHLPISNDAKVDTTLALAVFVCICKKIYMYANWKNLLSWSLKVVTKLFLTCLNRNKMQYHVSRIGPWNFCNFFIFHGFGLEKSFETLLHCL